MKKKFIWNIMSICYSIILISLFFSCEKENSDSHISEINMIEMGNQNLSDFSLIREREREDDQIEYVFQRDSDTATIFITCGIYSSPEIAKNICQEYLLDIALVMNEGTNQEESLGDEYWWWSPNEELSSSTNLLVLKRNVFFVFSTHSYNDLWQLAGKIGSDIDNESSYITFESN